MDVQGSFKLSDDMQTSTQGFKRTKKSEQRKKRWEPAILSHQELKEENSYGTPAARDAFGDISTDGDLDTRIPAMLRATLDEVSDSGLHGQGT